MKNLVLFSYFYNEEYLLPWWCEHHKKIFDHAILIDYESTDKSVDIIKSICPTWEIRKSTQSQFLAKTSDLEIMYAEGSIGPAYKLALGITEFLMVNKDFKDRLIYHEKNLQEKHHIFEFALSILRYTMVDSSPNKNPTHDDHLFKQKYTVYKGINEINGMYRQLHNSVCGQYIQGRHGSKIGVKDANAKGLSHPGEQIDILPEDKGSILWYGFSPWNKKMRSRKKSMSDKIPKTDHERGYGSQHFWNDNKLQEIFLKFRDNSENIDFNTKYNFWT